MKGLEKLTHITEEQRAQLRASSLQYKKHARIYFEVLSVQEMNYAQVQGWGVNQILVTIKVYQLKNVAGNYLNEKELKERVFDVLACVGFSVGDIATSSIHGWAFNVIAVPFRHQVTVDIDFINQRKTALGLSDVELSRLLDVRPENLSKILSDNRGLTKLGKAAFYYLFKYLEK